MMLFHLLSDIKQHIDPKKVDDIIVGNVLQVGSGIAQIRMAALMAGFPDSTAAASINRLCSSGLEAIATAADKIRANSIQIAIAGGVESMSQYEMMNMIEVEKIDDAVFEHEQARNCLMGMGDTSENVAQEFKISR